MKRLTLAVPLVCVFAVFGKADSIPAEFNGTPMFDEEFNGSALNTDVWDYRNLGPRRSAINVPDAVSVANGHLTITTYSGINASGQITNYTGMISTEKSFLPTYGYFEASVQYHYAPGLQVAFWLQSPTNGNPIDDPQKAGVEMDIFEHVGTKTNPLVYDDAFHWDGNGAALKSYGKNLIANDLQDGQFHTTGLAWTPQGYTVYFDGQVVDSVPTSVPVSAAPEYIILSSEVTETFPPGGYGSMADSAAKFDVDWVRVYSIATPEPASIGLVSMSVVGALLLGLRSTKMRRSAKLDVRGA